MTHRDERRLLVIGATGTMGGAVLTELLTTSSTLRVLVRRPQPTMDPRVEQIVGDLADETAVRAALTGIDAAFYMSPHEEQEEQLAELFVRVCAERRVRIVFAGVHCSSRTVRGWLGLQLFSLALPAYRPKLRIGQIIEKRSSEAVLICPSNFMDNDLLFLADIEAGKFPTPLRRVNRVAVSDIATVCADAPAAWRRAPADRPDHFFGQRTDRW